MPLATGEIDIAALALSVERSRLSLQRFREERLEAVRQYVGNHWSEEGTSVRVPVNLLSLYVSTIGRSLVAKNPRWMLSTFDRSMKPTVSAMEDWINQETEDQQLEQVLQRTAIDALFSIGVTKVSLALPAEAAASAWGLQAGKAYACCVDPDDFVYDIHGRSEEGISYIGHRFRVPLDAVRDSSLYDKSRKELTATSDPFYNMQGDERISVLGRSFYSDTYEFEPMIDLWEIYLPRYRRVVTLADDSITGANRGGKVALRDQPWVGPDTGPYHLLCLGIVPGNFMPKAPIQDLIDLHLAVNNGLRKMIRTNERLKEVTLVQGGATEDGSRLMKANDGEMHRVDDPKNITQIVMGGQHIQTLLATSTALKQLFNEMGGNLELLRGAGPQSKTAAQDELLNQNAGAGVADMQERTVNYVARVGKALLWYWWHDPFQSQTSQYSLPGLPGVSISRTVTPQMRKGPMPRMRVDPYSLRHKTPEMKLAELNQVMTQIVIPMMTLLVQQGVNVDINAYLKKIGQYMDMPDLAEILTIQQPPQPQGGGPSGGGEPPQPAKTERSYTRHNVSEQTPQSADRNLIGSMLGHNLGGNPNGNGQPQMAQ